MKVYFVGSISGREKFAKHYKIIIKTLKEEGLTVLEDTLRPSKEEVYSLNDDEKINFYRKVLKWINEADIIVAEVSYPSVGVGYELSLAVEKMKPAVVLYESGESPHFVEGIDSERVVVEQYDIENIRRVLKEAIKCVVEQQDTRFNFFISPKHQQYLDWIAKNRKIPRAVYLRGLIEEDMKKNKDSV